VVLARQLAVAFAAYVVAGGVVSFLGWALDVPRLADWDGDGVAIQPNAALLSAVAGLALLLLASGHRRVALGFGLLVAGVAAATLFQHATGRALGIDQVFMFGRPWGTPLTVAPGRMGFPAALAWTIGGTAIALATFRRTYRAASALGLCTVALGALSLTGYLFGAEVLYALPRLTAISLQTATFVFAAGVGIVASVPRAEPMRTLLADTSAGLMVRRTLPFLVALPLALGAVLAWEQRAGFYDASTGTAILVLMLVGLLCAVLWRGAAAVQQRERELSAVRQARVRADAARQATEGRIAALLESIDDAFASFDPEWRYTYLNTAGERSIGKSRHEVLGKVLWEEFPEARGTVLEASLRKAADSRCVVEFEAYNPVVDRWFSNRAYPTPGGGLAVYFRDLTESRRAEENLRLSEARLTAFLEQLPIGAGIWRLEGGWVIRNSALNRFVTETGPGADAMGLERWRARPGGPGLDSSGQDWPAYRALRGETVNPGIDFLHTLEDGRQIWTRVSAAPFRDASLRIVGAIVLIEDVDDQKRIEESLATARKELQVTTDNAPVLLAHVDAAGRYLFVNRPYAARFALTRDEVVGRTLPEVLGPAAYRPLARHVRAVLGGEEASFEVTFPRGRLGGQVMHVALTPERDGSGAVVGLVAALVDITDRKRAEDALRDADRRKDEFLATLAHELRNPLAPITTSVEILRRAGTDPAVASRTVGTLERQVRHMARLVDDLLDVSRITRNALALRTSPVDLAAVVAHALEAFLPQAERVQQQVVVDIEAGPPVIVDGDRARLVQIVGNLLSNAGRYSEPGSRITLTVRRDGADAVLTVADEGIGIPDDKLQRIFEPFTQLHPGLERSQGGLGIGLSLARRLATLHGGTLEAFSQGEGEGSQFVLRVPLQSASP